MICNGCEKPLGGGFLQENGKFLFARCVIQGIEHGTNMKAFQEIMDMCDSILGDTARRATKEDIRSIRARAKSILNMRSK